ncbi:hypothetical protein ACROYT_G025762 [Oculina patagonica]
MLQEVHCSQENSHLWATEWGYKSLFSSFSSKKAGVSILFNNNFDLQIKKTYTDDSGRLILCDLKTNGKSITLANIYAPNDDDPAFFKNLFDHLQDFEGEEIIIGGDFNLVLDVEKDKKGGLPKTHHNAQKTIHEICDNFDLVDAWRILNPEERSIISANILPGFKTDHSMITLNISLHSNPRGPGFWKLNTSLLADKDYIDLIRLTIRETQNEYENDESINPALLWDMIKLKTREKSLSFAAAKKRKTLNKQHELEEKIALLEKELEQPAAVSETQKTNKTQQLELFKSELEEIIKVRTQGAILRCKIKFQRLTLQAETEPLQKLVDYMKNQWIGSSDFPPRNWNVFKQPIRTNNDTEGWHNALNRRAGGHSGLPLYTLVELLDKEAKLTAVAIRLVSAEKLKRIQIKKYRNLQAKLLDSWDKYDKKQKTIDQLLKTCARLNGPARDNSARAQ